MAPQANAFITYGLRPADDGARDAPVPGRWGGRVWRGLAAC